MLAISLSIVSLAISSTAVTISIMQARLSRREANRSKPNIAATCLFTDVLYHAGKEKVKAVTVSVKNTGKEETDVSSLYVRDGDRLWVNGANCLLSDGGPVIPFRLNGHSQVSWIVDAAMVNVDKVTVEIGFGHGEKISRVIRLNQH